MTSLSFPARDMRMIVLMLLALTLLAGTIHSYHGDASIPQSRNLTVEICGQDGQHRLMPLAIPMEDSVMPHHMSHSTTACILLCVAQVMMSAISAIGAILALALALPSTRSQLRRRMMAS